MLVKPVTLLTPIAATAGNAFTPLVSINNIGELYDRAGGTLINGRTSTATVVDYQGVVHDCLANEIRYKGARRVDHADSTIYNAGVAGIEYFDTEADGVTPISPAPTILHEGAATNYVTYPDDVTQWSLFSATITDTGSTWSGMKKVAVESSGALFHAVIPLGGHSLSINDSIVLTFFYEAGTSGNSDIIIRNNTLVTQSRINGAVGSESVISELAGTVEILSNVVVSGSIRRFDILFTASVAGNYEYRIGPFSATSGENVYVYGCDIVVGKVPSSHIRGNGAATTRSADSIKLPLVVGTNFYQDRGVLLFRWVAGYDSDTTLNALLSINNGTGLLSDSATIDTLETTDGTNTTSIANSFVVGDEVLVAVVWAGTSLSINVSADGGSTWATWGTTTYDGAFDIGSYINWAYNNPHTIHVKSTKLYRPPNIPLAQIQAWVEQNAGSLTS